ncbi:MAG: hypothetical protein C4519_19995 [Desulfobacteraceae bacterium]|nr:MAG: hypothetical protein C4519_19995 [Desulfobacteraceae bacterium]
MTEPVDENAPTLLRYLEPLDSGLRFCLFTDGGAPGVQDAPLEAFEGAGPYAGLLAGTVGADRELPVGEIFFLIQLDHYRVSPGELLPVTNPQIDQLWQAGFKRLRGQRYDNFSAVLPEQVDAEGQLLPLRPLFHCRSKNRFGHALCPHCGGGLDLCRDDRLLKVWGLPGYSDSLERYLFCPACRQAGRDPSFYARVAPAESPAHLHDGDHLVQSFGRLLARQDLAGDLPCIGCDAAGDCYGPRTLVRERLRPLFFYPFYMLMQPEPSINALDFLELLSGVAFEAVVQKAARQQKGGRARKLHQHRELLASADRYLFPKGARLFGEVLYLKLTLLDELVALSIRTPEILDEPAACMSLESFWVHLPVQTTRLPLFWNFSLRMVDAVGRPGYDALKGVLPQARLRHFLGSAWFYTLLVNDRQGMAVVQNALEQLLSDAAAIARLTQGDGNSIDAKFSAANLVLQDGLPPAGPQWEALWRRALALGLELMPSARLTAAAWSADDFRSRLDALRRDVYDFLFCEPPAAETLARSTAETQKEAVPAHDAADAQIARILQTILKQWPSCASESPQATETAVNVAPPSGKPSAGALPNEDGDYQETVILGPDIPLAQNEAVPSKDPQEDLEQTVWMGPASSNKRPDQPPGGLEATVIISTRPDDSKPPAAPPELEKTVILGQPASGSAGGDLEETIIMSPGAMPRPPAPPVPPKTPHRSGGGANPPSPPENLEQTVIIRPDLVKNRKPGHDQ